MELIRGKDHPQFKTISGVLKTIKFEDPLSFPVSNMCAERLAWLVRYFRRFGTVGDRGELGHVSLIEVGDMQAGQKRKSDR
eukprot:1260540-Prymnesium_polylepis.1